MFSYIDGQSFWTSKPSLRQLRKDELAEEVKLGSDGYGVTSPVCLIFWNSQDKNGKPILISQTPRGKVVFPGREMKQRVEAGVLYRDLYLEHRFNRWGKSKHCVTSGVDYRTLDYWTAIEKQEKIQAIKEFRSASGQGLRESKAVMDYDMLLFWYSNSPYSNPQTSNMNSSTSSPAASLARLQEDLNRSVANSQFLRSRNTELESQIKFLEKELEDNMNELADEIERNKTKQPNHKKFYIFNPWEIIGCSPDDEYDVIETAIKKAIHMYHPDKVHNCGSLLQELSNEVTIQLLKLKKQLRRTV